MGEIRVDIGWTQAMALGRKLGYYYIHHPSPDNELLMEVSFSITAYCAAFEEVIHPPDFNAKAMQKMIEAIKPIDQKTADWFTTFELKRVIFAEGPTGRERLRREYMEFIMTTLNMLVDLGRKLLRTRELEAAGASEEEIQKARKEPADNPFKPLSD